MTDSQKEYVRFISELKKTKFSGDICLREDDRLVFSTDNSIYQIKPYAILFPKNKQDVILCLELVPRIQGVSLTSRGGGTGTNGQSLNEGLILDFSRYMNRILEVNPEEKWVKIEPGVVREELNTYLAAWGLYFAPEVSTSNRATIGGMISTDACGKGSYVVGRTADHVDDIEIVLLTGETIHTKTFEDKQKSDILTSLEAITKPIFAEQGYLARYRTGYNLEKIYKSDSTIDWKYLFAGSEGSLGVVVEAKLKLTNIPKYEQLLCLYYSSFESALQDATMLAEFKPQAIETVDATILSLAKQDVIYQKIKPLLPENIENVQAVNWVSFVSEKEFVLSNLHEQIKDKLSSNCIDYKLIQDPVEQKYLWDLRKKGVGLLSSSRGESRPIAFVEDTMVSPENLASYIAEFRAVLDEEKLSYGMFGHIDAGCLHVRPALNLRIKEDRDKVWRISEKIASLVKKYNGVFWGEHGKGIRSALAPSFLGETLYGCMQEVKNMFDPNNQLNPGKIATPNDKHNLFKLNTPLRGERLATINEKQAQEYGNALYCDGNGTCFNGSKSSVICPSYQGSRNRVYSPKGRAILLQEWLIQKKTTWNLYLVSKFFYSLQKVIFPNHIDHLTWQSMSMCLSCKACRTECPVKVDIASFRFLFLFSYYKKYYRPISDILIRFFEKSLPLQAKYSKFINFITHASIGKKIIKQLGWIDLPKLSEPSLQTQLTQQGVHFSSIAQLQQLTLDEKKQSVILLQDAFTSFYEASLVIDLIKLCEKLQQKLYILPFYPNGKALHIKGYKKQFEKYRDNNLQLLYQLGQFDIPIIGIEPAVTLTYRDEYIETQTSQDEPIPPVLLLQEWLWKIVKQRKKQEPKMAQTYYLLGHCTEKIIAIHSQEDWKKVFAHVGINLELGNVGCCGMAGMFGHERDKKQISRSIYGQSWGTFIQEHKNNVVATGFSCRSQVQKIDNYNIQHPLQVLLDNMNKGMS